MTIGFKIELIWKFWNVDEKHLLSEGQSSLVSHSNSFDLNCEYFSNNNPSQLK
jgi:hypothetical protein